MADISKDELIDLLKKRDGAGPTPGTDFLKGLETGARNAGKAFTSVAEGGINFQNATRGAGEVLGNFGKVGKLSGEALSWLGKYAQESVNAMRDFGKIGAGFGGDAMDMRVQIAGTRMTIEEYGKVLNKNKDLMTSMGGTVERGAVKFNEFSKSFFDNTASENLRMLGMTSEEINGTLAIELANRRFTNMEDAKAREAAIASAEAMATEMDKIAKLTGKSREAQQEEQAALQRDGKYQAAIRVAMMNGNKFAAEGMQAAMTTMGKFGAPVQALMKDFVAYGTASKESAATMAALGPAGQQMQEAVAMVKNAKTEEQKAAAQSALQAAERAVTERLASKEFNENAALGIKGFQEVANSTTSISAGMDKIAAEQGLDLKNAADRKRAAQELDKEAAEAQKRAQGKTAEGVSPGKATTDAVIKFEQAMQNSTAAVQKQVVEKLNNQIAPGMQKFADFLGGPTGRFSRENQEAKIKKIADDASALISQPGKTTEQAYTSGQEQLKAGEAAKEKAAAEGKSPEAQRAEELAARQRARKGEGTGGEGGGLLEKLTGVKFDAANFDKAVLNVGNLNKYAEGGFIPKPEIAMIGDGGPEFVLNMPQMKSLIEGVGLKGVKNLAGTAGTKMPSMPNIDVSKLASSTISQASSGNANIGKLASSLENQIKSLDLSKLGPAITSQMTKQVETVDLKELGSKITTQVESIDLSKVGPAITTQISSTVKEIGINTEAASEEAFQARKRQAEAAVEEAKVYKNSSEKIAASIEQEIAEKEALIANTETSERTKTRLMRELTSNREKLEQAKEQIIADTEKLNEAEKQLGSIQKENITKEVSTKEELIAQTNSIAEQTSPLLASKKLLNENEINAIGKELSNLGEERNNQAIREQNSLMDLQVLNNEKANLENNQQYAIRDLAETNEAIDILRTRIDQTDDAEEIANLQKELAEEEKLKNSLETRIAEREKTLLDVSSSIALKEQEVQDIREEAADTEAQIQEKKEELLSSITAFNEDQLAQEPIEFEESELAEPKTTIAPLGVDEEAAKAKEKAPAVDAYSSMLDKYFGPMKEPAKATDGVDSAKNKAKAAADEEAKQKAETEKTKTQQGAKDSKAPETKTTTETAVKPGGKEATLNDVVASLATLNKQVGALSFEMAKLPNLMEKSVKATKSLNGNINASL